MTHSFKPFDEDAIRRGACKEPETASLYLVYAEQTVKSDVFGIKFSSLREFRERDFFEFREYLANTC